MAQPPGREIEFPPGSGRKAFYEPHELQLLHTLTAKHTAGEISDDEYKNQVWWIHGLKVVFDGRFLTMEEAEAAGTDPRLAPPPPAEEEEQSTLFQVPPSVRRPF